MTSPSLAWQAEQPGDTISSASAILALDSLPDLKSISYFNDLKNSIDSLQSWQTKLNEYQLRPDSLGANQLQQIMALKANGDSLLNELEARQKQAETRLNQLENKAIKLQDSVHQALSQKIQQLRSKDQLSPKADSLWQRLDHSLAPEKLNDQVARLENAGNKIGEMDQLINQLKQEKISPEFTGDIDQKLSELKGTIIKKEQLASIKTQAEVWKSTFSKELQQLNQNINLEKLTRHQQQLEQYTGRLNTYQDQVSNAPETLEQKARELDEVKAFENQKATFSPYQEQMNQLGEGGYAKEQVVQKAKTMAKEHFAGKQEQLKAAQSKLAKLKQRMGKLGGGSLNGEKPKKQNEMKGKSLGERLVLGGNFQLHPGDEVSLDISPALGYRWTKMFKLGLGGTYRTTFDEKERFFLSDENEVFGYRGFAEHDVYKGFFAHAEYERLKSSRGLIQNSTVGDGNGDAWQNSALAGLGISYKIRNKIKGNVMLLYNFLYDEHSLYNKPLNLRFGFELIGSGTKKQKNKKTEKQ